MFNFFKKKVEKDDFEQFKQAVQTGFNNVKQDIGKTSTWIKHLDSKDSGLKEDLFEVKEELSSIKEELESLKNMISIMGKGGVFKQRQTVFNKQTAFNTVLNTVQTGVQTAILDNLSTTERAIVFVLLNSDMKLSYADLAAMLGKRSATIRGQINSIRQKSGGLIEEIITENNKKRVFIPEKIKKVLMKKSRVRAENREEKDKEDEE
jgi:uncharacterized protein YjgD (DUF1641 family)